MSKNVRAPIAYVRNEGRRPYYYANAHEKDYVPLAPVEMEIADVRGSATSLDREGFVLVEHSSAISDWTDREDVGARHPAEIVELMKRHTGADAVVVTGGGILRYSERSGKTGSTDNSHPARFAHVDMSREAAEAARAQAAPEGRTPVRSAQYNVWRAVSGPPQDVPLALCDWRSIKGPELIEAEAIFDPPGGAPEWRFASYVVAHDPGHRWCYFPDMRPDEAIIFKSSESDPARAQLMPHVAFDNPIAGEDAPPRVSIEMRCTAYWYG